MATNQPGVKEHPSANTEIIFIFRSAPKAARSLLFLVFGTREKGNPLEGSETRARSRERTEWTKAQRLPWTTAAGRYTETRDRRAHHHESSCDRIFFWIFDEAVPVDHIYASLDFVVWLCCIPFMGNDPPQFSWTDVVYSAVCVLSQTVRATW